jgi:hypothetical protein
MLRVACNSPLVTGVLWAKITSGAVATSSAAKPRMRPESKIATLAPATLGQALAECRHAGLRLRIAFGGPDQRADPAHSLAWLCAP